MSNYILAAYFCLLNRLTGNQDIVVGLPVAGQAVFDRPKQVGHMVQLLPVRVQLDENAEFRDLVNFVKNSVLDANEHPNFTFGKLIESLPLDRSRVPLISTIFNVDQAIPPLAFGDARVTHHAVPRSAESFELFLNVVPGGNQLLIEVTYSTSLFKGKSIVEWMGSMEYLLEQAVENDHIKLSEFSLCRNIPGLAMKANQMPAPQSKAGIIFYIEKYINTVPNKIAIISSQERLTYEQIGARINAISAAIHAKGIGDGDVVGISCARSVNLPLIVLAVHKVGACYLPLDPKFPVDRLLYMVEESGAKLIIEDDSTPEAIKTIPVVHLDVLSAQCCIHENSVSEITYQAQRLAYIIYTSGSSGKPKGVKIHHGAMLNFLHSMTKCPGLTDQDTLLAVTTLSFDISVLELFLPLLVGATSVIANQRDVSDGGKLRQLIESYGVNTLQATPGMWRLLLGAGWQGGQTFKALCGGETLPRDLVVQLLPLVGELWNMYGPTETTVWSTCYQVTDAKGPLCIGRPIDNTRCYVLDKHQLAVPVGVPGELYISGDGVGHGYSGRADLTAERFSLDPFDDDSTARMYRTGDSVRWNHEGELEYIDRIDNQVKVRGFRIELGEIESVLSRHLAIAQLVVCVKSYSELDQRLVAYARFAPGEHLTNTEVRRYLRDYLPDYMIPQLLVEVDTFPLTPNGKVDRKKLPNPFTSIGREQQLLEPETDVQKQIAAIWAEHLGMNRISLSDNFFDIGGHSMLAMLVIQSLEEAFCIKIAPMSMISCTLEQLADEVERQYASTDSKDDITMLSRDSVQQSAINQKGCVQSNWRGVKRWLRKIIRKE